MTVAAFDTLRFARALRDKAKLSPEQAEGFADAIAEAIQGDVATKSDVSALKIAVQSDITALRTTVQSDIAALRTTVQSDIAALKGTVQSDIAALKGTVQSDIAALTAKTQSDLREQELRLEAKIEATKAEMIKWMFGTIGFQTLIILGAVIALARLIRP